MAGLGGFATGLASSVQQLPYALNQKRMAEEEEARLAPMRELQMQQARQQAELGSLQLDAGRRSAEKVGAQELAMGLDRFMERGDAQGLDRFVGQNSEAFGKMFNLGPDRRVAGMDVRQGPDGKIRMSPRIANATTGSVGPMTEGATPLGGDRVVSFTPEELRGHYSHLLPAAAERFEVVQDPYGRGGVAQRSTTTGKISGYQAPAAEAKREREKDASGRWRYVDDGQLVFPGAKVPTKGPSALSPQGKLLADIESAKERYGADSPQAAFLQGELDVEKAKKPDFKSELSYAKEHEDRSKGFITQSEGFGRLVESAKLGTGPGDIGVVFGYMKTIDPESTVREGEFATAENTGGIPGWVRVQYNKAVRGERLTEQQRVNFVEAGTAQYRKAEAGQRGRDQWFTKNATEYGFSPGRVVQNFIDDELSALAGGFVENPEVVTVGQGEETPIQQQQIAPPAAGDPARFATMGMVDLDQVNVDNLGLEELEAWIAAVTAAQSGAPQQVLGPAPGTVNPTQPVPAPGPPVGAELEAYIGTELPPTPQSRQAVQQNLSQVWDAVQAEHRLPNIPKRRVEEALQRGDVAEAQRILEGYLAVDRTGGITAANERLKLIINSMENPALRG